MWEGENEKVRDMGVCESEENVIEKLREDERVRNIELVKQASDWEVGTTTSVSTWEKNNKFAITFAIKMHIIYNNYKY